MNIPYFTIRVLTLLSYFLPFIFFLSTCTSGVTLEDAYNKADAILNEKEKLENDLANLDTLFNTHDCRTKAFSYNVRTIAKTENSSSYRIKSLTMDFPYRLLMPTDYSLSAIGSIWLHKNIPGKTAISISLALSLITLIFYRVLDKRGISLQIISANTIVLIFFIADNLLSNVTTLYGAWILLFLLLVQLITEKRKFQTAITDKA